VLTGRPQGFALIELLTVVTIGGILLALALPQFTGFVASSRIRTAAEAYSNGLVLTRNEAIKQNTNVEFLMTGNLWQVRRLTDSAVLHEGSGKEGKAEVTATSTPAGATRITFDAFGRIVNASPVDGTGAITRIDFDVSNGIALGTKRRALRVLVETGGAVKLCDPLVAATDLRGCA
jgi:type IV fimbrial biogenesis protein FimT